MPRTRAEGSLPSPWARKTVSTASIHSRRLSDRSTSVQLSNIAGSVCIWSSDKIRNIVARSLPQRETSSRLKIRAPFSPLSMTVVVLAQKPRAFAHADNGSLVLLQKLKNAFLLRLAHVGRVWIRILKMRANLKRHQTQRVERAGLHNRHVLGGFDRRTSDVGTGATADIRRAASSLSGESGPTDRDLAAPSANETCCRHQ